MSAKPVWCICISCEICKFTFLSALMKLSPCATVSVGGLYLMACVWVLVLVVASVWTRSILLELLIWAQWWGDTAKDLVQGAKLKCKLYLTQHFCRSSWTSPMLSVRSFSVMFPLWGKVSSSQAGKLLLDAVHSSFFIHSSFTFSYHCILPSLSGILIVPLDSGCGRAFTAWLEHHYNVAQWEVILLRTSL